MKIQNRNNENTKIGKHPSEIVLTQFHGTGEKGPAFLCNPLFFRVFPPAKLTAGKFRVFVIALGFAFKLSRFPAFSFLSQSQ